MMGQDSQVEVRGIESQLKGSGFDPRGLQSTARHTRQDNLTPTTC